MFRELFDYDTRRHFSHISGIDGNYATSILKFEHHAGRIECVENSDVNPKISVQPKLILQFVPKSGLSG